MTAQPAPDALGEVTITTGARSYTVRLPAREQRRATEIIRDNAYSILTRRRHDGPLRVVDIGANVGLFAIYAKLLDLDSCIHCFEPAPDTLALLEHNLRTVTDTHLHGVGLSNWNGTAELNLHGANAGRHSVVRRDDGYDGSVLVAMKDAASEFDRYGLGDVDIVKIDTEGCEVDILTSLGPRLERVDYLLVEYHSEEDRRSVDALLSEFRVFGSSALVIECGVVKYVNRRLLDTDTHRQYGSVSDIRAAPADTRLIL